MAHKFLKQLLVFVAAVLTGCTTNMDYHIVGSGTETVTEVVYEKSFNDAVLYANKWEAQTAKRKKLHDLETKAMEEIIERDKANGTMLSLD